jgi:hypothetical protein
MHMSRHGIDDHEQHSLDVLEIFQHTFRTQQVRGQDLLVDRLMSNIDKHQNIRIVFDLRATSNAQIATCYR